MHRLAGSYCVTCSSRHYLRGSELQRPLPEKWNDFICIDHPTRPPFRPFCPYLLASIDTTRPYSSVLSVEMTTSRTLGSAMAALSFACTAQTGGGGTARAAARGRQGRGAEVSVSIRDVRECV